VTSYEYRIVDVFTEVAFEGNALAVVLGADDLDAATMQRVAREFNLSETVFILSPARDDCAVRFRIFTPASELAFAGHPTIGGAFVVRDVGLVTADLDCFVIDEGIGGVPVRVDRYAERIWLTTPPIAFGPTLEYRMCAPNAACQCGLGRDLRLRADGRGGVCADVRLRARHRRGSRDGERHGSARCLHDALRPLREGGRDALRERAGHGDGSPQPAARSYPRRIGFAGIDVGGSVVAVARGELALAHG